MTDHPKEAVSCGVCGEPMQSGHIWLAASYPAAIQWLSERPALSAWRFWKQWQGERLLFANQRMSPKTVRAAHRCPKCHTLTIEHVDKEMD